MKRFLPSIASGRAITRRLLLAGIVLLAAWLLFFDSHSIMKRVQWHREYVRLNAANVALEEKIDRVSEDLEKVGSDEVVEKIAREQYGMRRPGETVYPLQKE